MRSAQSECRQRSEGRPGDLGNEEGLMGEAERRSQ